MTTNTSEIRAEFAELERDDWFDALDELAEEHGHFETIGDNHVASFIDAGPKLLVTFETYPDISNLSEDAEPRGFHFVRKFGWSHLAIIAKDRSWFREDRLYRYFDRLIDDGFFEDFEQVLFYGAHQGGYAAAAYSVAAPGSRVLALRPVATLDPRIAGFDNRYRRDRRLDFTSRYGFAPDMIEATQHTYIVYDPREVEDATHGALFARNNVSMFTVPFLGNKIDQAFDSMHILAPLVEYAMSGDLTREGFAELYRARRNNVPYLRSLTNNLDRLERKTLAARVCRYVLSVRERPYFQRRLRELEGEASTAAE